MKTVQQVSVIIDNAPGTLSRICASLQEHEVNVQGFACWGESDHGVVRMICDRPLKALDLLEEAGMIALQHEVLELSRENRPGVLLEVAEALCAAGVNIQYAYGTTPDQTRGSMYLGVDDPKGALEALRSR